jgi:hypothetical protein
VAAMPAKLTKEALLALAKAFCIEESETDHEELFGVTDGKAVGAFVEHLFQARVLETFDIGAGSSAKGIDLPAINTDTKVTSIKQPQSSCPFKSAREKIYGLGYELLLFVYDKKDDPKRKAARLKFVCCALVEKHRTADFQTTRGLLDILKREGNRDEVIAFLMERNLPADEITLNKLADEIMKKPPTEGYLTMSNALQWRLQYGRVVALKASIQGVEKVL